METLPKIPGLLTPPEYAQVIVDVDAKALDKRTFTYRIPEEFRRDIRIGVPVAVPFGRIQGVSGFVVGFSNTLTETFSVKEISEVLDDSPLFNLDYLKFLEWVSDYYATPLTQVISCALPSQLLQKSRKEVVPTGKQMDLLALRQLNKTAQEILAFLTEKNRAYTPKFIANQVRATMPAVNKALATLKQYDYVEIRSQLSAAASPKTVKRVRLVEEKGSTKRQQQILDYLKAHGGEVLMKELLESVETTPATVQKLALSGAVAIEEGWAIRDPLAHYAELAKKAQHSLSDAQNAAVEAVLSANDWENGSDPFLLYGVTGSGKTEVYLSLTARMLAEGKSVMMMVPEIALTSQISKRFIERFGVENIALWHSNLSAGEKTDTWCRLLSGDLQIVIGARSAIFAPLQNLGLILMDEEHDNSFKQDSPAPRYNAKTLALELARRTGAKVVGGSATPDISTFYHAQDTNRILVLPERFGGRAMATVELVDMKNERSAGNSNILSRLLKEELGVALEAKEQSIILINRRGFYTIISCVDCDHTFQCPQCTVALTYHRARNQVRCHYCGFEQSMPQYCPHCASMDLSTGGIGTQRVEDEIAKAFPEARVLRLDSDVMQRKNAYREIFEAFASGEADILVGTQMIAKGLDIPNVTRVGVIGADSTFCLPDFKSAERGFQLLTQVAGRAGRGLKEGRVVVQSLQPNHPVIQLARAQDYEGFYEYELTSRREMKFPPFSQLFRIIVSGEDEFKAKHFIQAACMNLQAIFAKEGLQEEIPMLGPAACVISRIQGKYRFHCLLKNLVGERGHKLITDFYKAVTPPPEINFILDIDTQTLL